MRISREFLSKEERAGFFLLLLFILALRLPIQALGKDSPVMGTAPELRALSPLELSKEKIIQAAMEAFEKKQGKLQERVILYDIGNGRWQEKFKAINKEMARKFTVLDGKNYQAVCFSVKPKFGLKGKNIWVFVDKLTGEAIALYVE